MHAKASALLLLFECCCSRTSLKRLSPGLISASLASQVDEWLQRRNLPSKLSRAVLNYYNQVRLLDACVSMHRSFQAGFCSLLQFLYSSGCHTIIV